MRDDKNISVMLYVLSAILIGLFIFIMIQSREKFEGDPCGGGEPIHLLQNPTLPMHMI